jgi:hypothetical protein
LGRDGALIYTFATSANYSGFDAVFGESCYDASARGSIIGAESGKQPLEMEVKFKYRVPPMNADYFLQDFLFSKSSGVSDIRS